MKYILSKYTRILEKNEDNHIVIYNTYNGVQSYIYDQNIMEQINLLKENPIDEDKLHPNIISNFCVPYNINESEFVYNQIQNIINDDELLSIIIFPTLDCNFKCIYCYEEREKGFMDDNTLENIYSSIKNRYENIKFKYLRLEWFGGEPLLFKNKLIEFTRKVNNFCELNNVIYQHTITTNGYLLDDSTINALLDSKIEMYQVTIDGMPSTHDKYRSARDGKNTWEKIMNNLFSMKSLNRKFRVLIRINYNYEILASIEEFLKFIRDNFSDDTRFEVMFKAIGHWGGENDHSVNAIPLEYQAFIMDEMLKKCNDYNILSSRHFNFSCGSELCYANKKNSLIIYKNGTIGKCTLEEAPDIDSDFVIGDINSGYFNIDPIKEALWCRNDKEFLDYLEDSNCFDCIAYPFCCGTSCPAHRVRFGLSMPNKCTPTKSRLDNIVKLNYLINK